MSLQYLPPKRRCDSLNLQLVDVFLFHLEVRLLSIAAGPGHLPTTAGHVTQEKQPVRHHAVSNQSLVHLGDPLPYPWFGAHFYLHATFIAFSHLTVKTGSDVSQPLHLPKYLTKHTTLSHYKSRPLGSSDRPVKVIMTPTRYKHTPGLISHISQNLKSSWLK